MPNHDPADLGLFDEPARVVTEVTKQVTCRSCSRPRQEATYHQGMRDAARILADEYARRAGDGTSPAQRSMLAAERIARRAGDVVTQRARRVS